MNICVVSPFPLYQPPYSYVGAFEAWWKPLSLKHNIFAVSSEIDGTNPSEYFPGSKIRDIRLPSMFVREIPYTIPDPIRMLNILLNIDKRYGIDLVHVIKIMFIPTFYAAVFTKMILRKPLIASIHGTHQYTPRNFVGLMARVYRETAAKATLSLADKVVVLTSSLSSFAVNMGVPRTKIECIAIGPDLERFQPRNKMKARRKLGLPLEKFIVLYLGSLRLIKGVHYLVKAAKILLKTRSDLVFIFGGEGLLKERLIEETKEIKKQAFLFPGYIHKTEEYLAAADVLVLPSFSEGLPMVLLEAQAMGKPVIATNVGGVSDLIKNEENGLIIRPMDIREIERSILMLINDKGIRDEIGKNGMINVQKNFNFKILSKKLETLYVSEAEHLFP